MTRTSLLSDRGTCFVPVVLTAILGLVLSAAQAETADEIVAANIVASGGDAIARIENFTSTGTVAVGVPGLGELKGTIEAVRVPGRGYFEKVHIGPIYQQKGWDGVRAWQRDPAGCRLLEGYDEETLVLQSFPNTFAAFEAVHSGGPKIERRDDAEIGGRPQYVLDVSTDNGAATTLYLDRQTTLLTRSVTRPNPGQPPIVVDIGDYKAYAGVMMPTSVTINADGTSAIRLKLDSTVVNTAVDESGFEMPCQAPADDENTD